METKLETLLSLANCLVDNSDIHDKREMLAMAREVLGWAGVIKRKLAKDVPLEDEEVAYIMDHLQ